MYLCKQLTDLSYPEIGKQFNDKHHSTVMYSVDKIDSLRGDDPDLDRTIKGWVQHFS
jgi:chromosomal replication initiator protein